MPDLVRQLDELFDTLRSLQRPVAKLLRPGLSNSAIEELVEDLPVKLTDDVKQLYAWRDGTTGIADRKIDEVCLFPNYYFPNLESAVVEFQGWLNLFETSPSECPVSTDWFQIFLDVGGCYYAIDCGSESTQRGSVVEYIPDYGGEVVFANLSKMISSLTECYRQGVYFVGANGRLTYDDKKALPLFKALNPEIPAWSRRLRQMELIWNAGRG